MNSTTLLNESELIDQNRLWLSDHIVSEFRREQTDIERMKMEDMQNEAQYERESYKEDGDND